MKANSTPRNGLRCFLNLTLLTLVLGGRSTLASPPEQMNFQGYLEDENGAAIGQQSVVQKNIQLRLYTASTGGTAVWGEVQTGVLVDRGIFNIRIGNGSTLSDSGQELPHGNLSALFQEHSTLFLGVQLAEAGSMEITPRMQFLTSPYAWQATGADAAAVLNTAGGAGLVSWSEDPGKALTPTGSVGTGYLSVPVAITGGTGLSQGIWTGLVLRRTGGDLHRWQIGMTTDANGNRLAFSKNGGSPFYFDANGNQTNPSDRRLKKDISPLKDGVLNRLIQTDVVSYRFRNQATTVTPAVGYIAQDIEKFFPDVVDEINDTKTVNYGAIGVYSVKAIQELNQKTDSELTRLRDENAQLRDEAKKMRQDMEGILKRLQELEAARN